MNTPILVYAYANNQWELDGAIPVIPAESFLFKDMAAVQGYIITILDKDDEEGL